MIDTSKFLINNPPVPFDEYNVYSPYHVFHEGSFTTGVDKKQQEEYNLYNALRDFASEHGLYILDRLDSRYNKETADIERTLLNSSRCMTHWASMEELSGKYGWIIQEYIKQLEAWNKC